MRAARERYPERQHDWGDVAKKRQHEPAASAA